MIAKTRKVYHNRGRDATGRRGCEGLKDFHVLHLTGGVAVVKYAPFGKWRIELN